MMLQKNLRCVGCFRVILRWIHAAHACTAWAHHRSRRRRAHGLPERPPSSPPETPPRNRRPSAASPSPESAPSAQLRPPPPAPRQSLLARLLAHASAAQTSPATAAPPYEHSPSRWCSRRRTHAPLLAVRRSACPQSQSENQIASGEHQSLCSLARGSHTITTP